MSDKWVAMLSDFNHVSNMLNEPMSRRPWRVGRFYGRGWPTLWENNRGAPVCFATKEAAKLYADKVNKECKL